MSSSQVADFVYAIILPRQFCLECLLSAACIDTFTPEEQSLWLFLAEDLLPEQAEDLQAALLEAAVQQVPSLDISNDHSTEACQAGPAVCHPHHGRASAQAHSYTPPE